MRDRRPSRARPLVGIALLAGLFLLGPASEIDAAPLQCVQYVRSATSVPLKGDAWTWWNKATHAGLKRGAAPRQGSILVMKRTDKLPRGHVAVVAEVINSREILIDHANWAPRRSGKRGQIDTGVRAIDVSPKNDWSKVRVWYTPTEEIGQRAYPTYGFIYAPPIQKEYIARMQQDDEIAMLPRFVRAED